MRIATISIAKPEEGTGNGTTEYAFALIGCLKKMGNTVDAYYGTGRSKRYDIMGLVKTTTIFPRTIKKIAKKDYDIIHITIQELGFAAKILKENGTKAKIVTTVHDLVRLDKRFQKKGVLESTYNRMVGRSVANAVKYSDFILFNSEQTKKDTEKAFGKLKNSRVVLHGTKAKFLSARKTARRPDGNFRVGYIGSFTANKNVISMLKTARFLLGNRKIRFMVYGSGLEYRNIAKYRKDNNLENVILGGMVPDANVIRVYDSFDAFMMPSQYEGFSHMILEAQARGLPVIIFKHAKIPQETAKYCIKASDEKDAARIIERIRINGANQVMLANARTYARIFTWEKNARETFEVYKKILSAD
jgi:glycosyltransferase involved in cell wall biosynthesis